MKFYSIEIVAIVLAIVVISIFVVVWVRKQDIQTREAEKLAPPPGQQPTEEDVIRLARAGHKIAAIKLYREIHRVGLAEAKNAVENLEAHGVRGAGETIPPQTESAMDQEVTRLTLAGHKIEAVKRYREIHRVGLAEAKAAVEDIMARGDRER